MPARAGSVAGCGDVLILGGLRASIVASVCVPTTPRSSFFMLFSQSPQMKLITASGLVERLKVNGSLARAAIRELEGKGLIRKVDAHHAQVIYTRATNVEE